MGFISLGEVSRLMSAFEGGWGRCLLRTNHTSDLNKAFDFHSAFVPSLQQ